jgi:hypothetical protein
MLEMKIIQNIKLFKVNADFNPYLANVENMVSS